MIDLNDVTAIHAADTQHLLEQKLNLSQQLADGWNAAKALELPESFAQIDRVVIAGMGESGLAGAIMAARLASISPVSITVIRDDDLPAFTASPRTLVIVISASGETEETLRAFDVAHLRGCQLLAITGPGSLADRAAAQGTVLPLGHANTIGFVVAALLNIAVRLKWTPAIDDDLAEAIEITQKWSHDLAVESPVAQNLAKREAGQIMGRWAVITGAGYLAPIAEYWKQQINMVAKAWACSETIPDANHHALAGTDWPADFEPKVMALFLTGISDRPRHAQRLALTQRTYMLRGCNTDLIRARGHGPLAQMMSLLLLGDAIGSYLALLYGADPAGFDALIDFKKELG